MSNSIILVLGGHGFIGRAVVNELRRRKLEVIIGTRANNRKLGPGERRIAFHKATAQEWQDLITGCDVVVNAVGIIRQRHRESYQQVHHSALAHLAGACAAQNTKLIHVSALGLYNQVKSRFLTSKRQGEERLIASKADWALVRSALLEGDHGYGARWFRKVANWPVHFIPAKTGHLAPLHVTVLARRIADIAEYNFACRIHEIGGGRVFTYQGYLRSLASQAPALTIILPNILVRIASHLFDLLHITPLSFGHYELMKYDNVPAIDREILGAERDFAEISSLTNNVCTRQSATNHRSTVRSYVQVSKKWAQFMLRYLRGVRICFRESLYFRTGEFEDKTNKLHR